MKEIVKSTNKSIVIANPYSDETYKQYLSEISGYKVFTREEEVDLFTRLSKGDETIVDLIIKHNLKFVVMVAKSHQNAIRNTTLSLEDLISEGNIGLMTAIRTFDATRGFKFISYAVWSINQMILSSIKKNKKTIRMIEGDYSKLSKLRNIERNLEQIHGRNIDDVELLEVGKEEGIFNEKINIEYVAKLKNHNSSSSSLTQPLGGEDNFSLMDILSDPNSVDIIEDIKSKDISRFLSYILDHYVPIDVKKIFTLYYGLDGCKTKTLTEIGEELEITGTCVRQKMGRYERRLKYRFRLTFNNLTEH